MISDDGRVDLNDGEKENENISLPYNLVEPWHCPNIWQPRVQLSRVIPEPIGLRSVIREITCVVGIMISEQFCSVRNQIDYVRRVQK